MLVGTPTYDSLRCKTRRRPRFIGVFPAEVEAARTGMKCPCYEAAPDESGLRRNTAGKRSLRQVRGIDPPLLCSPATSSPGGGVQQTSKCQPIFACN